MQNSESGLPQGTFEERYAIYREKSKAEDKLAETARQTAKTLAADILEQCQRKGFTEAQVEAVAERLEWEIKHTLREARKVRKFTR